MALIFTFIIYWQVDMVTARNERAGDDNKKKLRIRSRIGGAWPHNEVLNTRDQPKHLSFKKENV